MITIFHRELTLSELSSSVTSVASVPGRFNGPLISVNRGGSVVYEAFVSHFVAEVEVESTGAPRQALVRWVSGTPTVIATTGAPLPGHPSMMVERFGGGGVDETGTSTCRCSPGP